MLSIEVDRRQLSRLMRELPDRHHKAMRSALRAEAYRLRKVEQTYARSMGGGSWAAMHPLTPKIRKNRRQGLGKWWARYARYHVDDEALSAVVGILGRDQIKRSAARFEPISPAFAAAAYRHARGYQFRVTRSMQNRIAGLLRERYKREASWTHLIPRIGLHTVKARSVAHEVMVQEQHRTVRNLATVYRLKLGGQRYSMSDLMKE